MTCRVPWSGGLCLMMVVPTSLEGPLENNGGLLDRSTAPSLWTLCTQGLQRGLRRERIMAAVAAFTDSHVVVSPCNHSCAVRSKPTCGCPLSLSLLCSRSPSLLALALAHLAASSDEESLRLEVAPALLERLSPGALEVPRFAALATTSLWV